MPNNTHLKYNLLREVLVVLVTLLCTTASRANVHETRLALMMTLKHLFILEPVLRTKKYLKFATYNASLILKKMALPPMFLFYNVKFCQFMKN